jgi:hypothetical protein
MDLPGDLRRQLVGNAFHRSPRPHRWAVVILPPFRPHWTRFDSRPLLSSIRSRFLSIATLSEIIDEWRDVGVQPAEHFQGVLSFVGVQADVGGLC